MNRRTAWSLAILVAAMTAGALREFLFINLNYQIDFVGHERAFSYAHSAFRAWVDGWDLNGLLALKWGFSFLFIAINLLLAVSLARVRLGDHRYRSVLLVGFLIAGTITLTAHLAAPYVPGSGTLSVKLLHAMQYPVLLLLLWAATWLTER